MPPCRFTQSLSATLLSVVCSPKGAKDLTSPVLKSFLKIERLTAKDLLIHIKLKTKFQIYEYLPSSLLTKKYQAIPLKPTSNIVSPSL